MRLDCGSIPPTVLEFSNTESNSHYLRACKEKGIKPHPARFPIVLPDFFIRFLTKPGELILDPFAGSNVAGEAAERLGRKWIGVEINEEYVKASALRFEKPSEKTEKPLKRHALRHAASAENVLTLPFTP